ncbi:hypothetical protein DFQ27_006564 [Actinomortierella ambigua]|uniref:Uncharacterized protein n=1 Tax=Actinomortierella ambigua TaxID=1343610 RepID=A0A9P6UC37_9FUNG|nr:hypothetical protein DFQ27_006564 [Actinomortierella ambigua]
MDGVDLDWCLVCEKHTNGTTYCSPECRSSDLVSSSASSASSTSSIPSAYYSSGSDSASSTGSPPSSVASSIKDNYPMPPFVRKQRTSIPNIYAQCTANPHPPAHLLATPGGSVSALSHHLHQHQHPMSSSSGNFNINGHHPGSTGSSAPSSTSHGGGSHHLAPPLPPSTSSVSSSAPNSHGQGPASATQYPLFYAALNALRSGGSPPDSSSDSQAPSRSLTSGLSH